MAKDQFLTCINLHQGEPGAQGRSGSPGPPGRFIAGPKVITTVSAPVQLFPEVKWNYWNNFHLLQSVYEFKLTQKAAFILHG